MAASELQKRDYQNSPPDTWKSLKAFTPARIALGRTGTSVPLQEALSFRLAHAHARDAVYSSIAIDRLYDQLKILSLPVFTIKSKAKNRVEYLKRPDLGRLPYDQSTAQLKDFSLSGFDVAFIIADGLSAAAVNMHAAPLLKILVDNFNAAGHTLAPVVIAEQARVAIGDPIGEMLKTKVTVVLIGERPGLSCTTSLSAYLTYNPQSGQTDEMRNCVSNIHENGLSYSSAADKIFYLVQEALRRKLSGVALKDEMGLIKES